MSGGLKWQYIAIIATFLVSIRLGLHSGVEVLRVRSGKDSWKELGLFKPVILQHFGPTEDNRINSDSQTGVQTPIPQAEGSKPYSLNREFKPHSSNRD